MLFNVEHDLGHSIRGYVVADGIEESVQISVLIAGEPVYEAPATDLRESLVQGGRHRTGLCGFLLDEQIIPNLSHAKDVEIRAGDILLYRRLNTHHIPKKLLRLETHLFPQWRLDLALNPHFQYSANQIEITGHETIMQMLQLHNIPSVYISGRLPYRTLQTLIEGRFETICSLHNPYEDLAEKLIVLAEIARRNSPILGLREILSLRPVMHFAQTLPFHNERALAKALRKIPDDVARALANPLTRQLTTTTPDEMPARDALTQALHILSSFQIVGLRRDPESFIHAVEELVGQSEMPRIHTPPGVTHFARQLQQTGEIDWLIEDDLALYEHIVHAYNFI